MIGLQATLNYFGTQMDCGKYFWMFSILKVGLCIEVVIMPPPQQT